MIPEVYIIRDEDGNEIAIITHKEGKFTIETDKNYSVEIPEN
jgi:hypothetical protein